MMSKEIEIVVAEIIKLGNNWRDLNEELNEACNTIAGFICSNAQGVNLPGHYEIINDGYNVAIIDENTREEHGYYVSLEGIGEGSMPRSEQENLQYITATDETLRRFAVAVTQGNLLQTLADCLARENTKLENLVRQVRQVLDILDDDENVEDAG